MSPFVMKLVVKRSLKVKRKCAQARVVLKLARNIKKIEVNLVFVTYEFFGFKKKLSYVMGHTYYKKGDSTLSIGSNPTKLVNHVDSKLCSRDILLTRKSPSNLFLLDQLLQFLDTTSSHVV